MSASQHTIRMALQRSAFCVDVDLQLPAHGITVLWGPSGSGKTSILRSVAGLERPQKALLQIAGETWQDDAQKLFVPPWKRAIGYVFQEASLFEHLDVQGNLRYGQQRASDPAAAAQALQDAIALLDIATLLPRQVHTLSGGERQRVAIARALATAPRVLLLDEPLASLDAARRREVMPWLLRLRDELKIPMLYVTHAVDEVAKLADTVVTMERGQATGCGPVSEVLAGQAGLALAADDVGSLLHARVQEIDAQWGLARADFQGGALWLRDTGLALGNSVRLRVLARDVSIALVAPQSSSIQNVLPCVVSEIRDDDHPSQVLVRLLCGSQALWARITARSAHTLALQPGLAVWAQVKSVGLVSG